MASSSQSVVADLLRLDATTNYVAVAIITVVGYDYILTIPREVEYIWNKPWTFVSTFFVIIRYIGLCSFITLSFADSSFLPGTGKASSIASLIADLTILTYSCEVSEIIGGWTVSVFLIAADFVMILRVWAMYDRSKLILGTLLTFYVVEIITTIIHCILYSNPRNDITLVSQVPNLTICVLVPTLTSMSAANITQLIHAAVMCTLATIQFTRRSFQMYKATRQWRLSQFMNLLVIEGVLYFFAILTWNLMVTLYTWGKIPTDEWIVIPIHLVTSVPVATLTARFVLNMRELYARDIHGRHRSGIDTGFGLSSSGYGASTIVFARGGQDEGSEHGEEIQTEGRVTV